MVRKGIIHIQEDDSQVEARAEAGSAAEVMRRMAEGRWDVAVTVSTYCARTPTR